MKLNTNNMSTHESQQVKRQQIASFVSLQWPMLIASFVSLQWPMLFTFWRLRFSLRVDIVHLIKSHIIIIILATLNFNSEEDILMVICLYECAVKSNC